MVLAAGFEYAMRRQAFGKPLIEQPVVRHRLAKAIGELETQWAWVESFVYQMVHMKKDVADTKLGGLTALAKAKSAMVLNECAQTAQLLFGGNGYTKGGQGALVEKAAREVAGARIPVCLWRLGTLTHADNDIRVAARTSCSTWLFGSCTRITKGP